MKKLLLSSVLVLLTISPVLSFAVSEQEEVNKVINDLREKYQHTADFFSESMIPFEDYAESFTRVITYEHPGCQIGFFSDGFIITYINGENKGKQIVVCRDKIIGISYPCEHFQSSVRHRYIWGNTYTKYDEVSVCANLRDTFLDLLD